MPVYNSVIPPKHIWSYILYFFEFVCIIPPVRYLLFRFVLKKCINCTIEPGFRFYYGHNIKAINVTFSNVLLMDYDSIEIGEGSGFSKDCIVITGDHDLIYRNKIVTKPVKIGKKVWVATRSIILPGVTIGDNVVIGAGSVVTRSLPPNVIAAGNPAKIIKRYK